jgi:HAD superfamily hydrolase (TIGR01484 family)
MKMLVSDYDGTFYTDSESINQNIIKVAEFRNNGNLFVIATGRSYEDFKDEIIKYHIPFDYLILNLGSVILDKNRNTFKTNFIDKKIVLLISNYLLSCQERIKKNILYSTWKNNVSIKCRNITKIGIELYSLDSATHLAKKINEQFGEYINAYAIAGMRYILVEIVPVGINKGESIEEIALDEKINKENIYTIGNGANDLEMLRKYNGNAMTDSEEVIINNIKNLYNYVYELIDNINVN